MIVYEEKRIKRFPHHMHHPISTKTDMATLQRVLYINFMSDGKISRLGVGECRFRYVHLLI